MAGHGYVIFSRLNDKILKQGKYYDIAYLTPGQYYKISQLYLGRNWSRFSESVSTYSTCPEGKGLVGAGPRVQVQQFTLAECSK